MYGHSPGEGKEEGWNNLAQQSRGLSSSLASARVTAHEDRAGEKAKAASCATHYEKTLDAVE